MATKQNHALEQLRTEADRALAAWKAADDARTAAASARRAMGENVDPMVRAEGDVLTLETDQAEYEARFAAREAANAYDIAKGDEDAIAADWSNTAADLRIIQARHASIEDVRLRNATIMSEASKRTTLANEAQARLAERRKAEGRPQPRGSFGPHGMQDFWSAVTERANEALKTPEWPRHHQLTQRRREVIRMQANEQREYLKKEAQRKAEEEREAHRLAAEAAQARKRAEELAAEQAKFAAEREEEERLAADYRARRSGQPAPVAEPVDLPTPRFRNLDDASHVAAE